KGPGIARCDEPTQGTCHKAEEDHLPLREQFPDPTPVVLAIPPIPQVNRRHVAAAPAEGPQSLEAADPAHRQLKGGMPFAKAPFQNLRSEEHTSELQSRENLVCRLLLEKKNIL